MARISWLLIASDNLNFLTMATDYRNRDLEPLDGRLPHVHLCLRCIRPRGILPRPN